MAQQATAIDPLPARTKAAVEALARRFRLRAGSGCRPPAPAERATRFAQMPGSAPSPRLQE